MSVLRVGDEWARYRPEMREAVRVFAGGPQPGSAIEGPQSVLRDWPSLRPSLPKQGVAARWAAVVLALHGLLLVGLMPTRPLALAPVKAPGPASSLRWVDVRLLPSPPQSLAYAHQAPSPSAPRPPAFDVAPRPLMPLPIPALALNASSESPSTATTAGTINTALSTNDSSLALTDRPIARAQGSALPQAQAQAQGQGQMQVPMQAQLPPQALAQQRDRPHNGPLSAPSDRSPPVASTDQPAAFPASHQSCQDAQTTRHYPALLRERGVQGQVRLRVKVDEHGRAAEVLVAQGSGFRLLDEAARRVAESCPYLPARRGDQQVASWIEYAVRFALSPAEPGSL